MCVCKYLPPAHDSTITRASSTVLMYKDITRSVFTLMCQFLEANRINKEDNQL